MNSIFARHFACESISDAAVEIEKCYFGKIAEPEELKNASKMEKIEQWEIRSPNGVMRVRCYNDEEYEFCVKKNAQGENGDTVRVEKEMDIDKEFFVLMRSLSTCGTIKRRYEFPIEGTDLKWEVDVYDDADDKPIIWCKIDLEIPNKNHAIPQFPITLVEFFDSDDCSDEYKQFQRELFEKKYNRINTNNIQVPFED